MFRLKYALQYWTLSVHKNYTVKKGYINTTTKGNILHKYAGICIKFVLKIR